MYAGWLNGRIYTLQFFQANFYAMWKLENEKNGNAKGFWLYIFYYYAYRYSPRQKYMKPAFFTCDKTTNEVLFVATYVYDKSVASMQNDWIRYIKKKVNVVAGGDHIMRLIYPGNCCRSYRVETHFSKPTMHGPLVKIVCFNNSE